MTIKMTMLKRTRTCILIPAILLAGGMLFSPHTGAGAAANTDFGYTAREYPLAGGPSAESVSGYRAYLPKRKSQSAQSAYIVILVSGWTCGPAWLHYAAAWLAGQQGIETWTVKRRMAFYEDRASWRDDLAAIAPSLDTPAPARAQKGAASPAGARTKAEALARLRDAANYFKGSDPRVLDGIGYGVLLDDLDAVVRAAAAKKRPVILGGWSDGVEYVMAYAQRRYADGKRGHERLRGLLFIDEDPEWGRLSETGMRQELAKKRALAANEIYERRAPAVPIFEALGVLAARGMGLSAASSLDGASPLGFSGEAVPLASGSNGAREESPFAAFFPQRPQGRFSDAALLGWLYSGSGYNSGWDWLASAGSFDYSATPIGWRDGGNTPLARLAAIHTLPDGVWEWFYPHRIAVDYWELGLAGFAHEGLRIAPDMNNRLPVFAALSGFNPSSGTGLPAGIRWWVERTGIAREQITLMRFPRFRHADILLAPATEEEVWARFALWLGALSGAPSK